MSFEFLIFATGQNSNNSLVPLIKIMLPFVNINRPLVTKFYHLILVDPHKNLFFWLHKTSLSSLYKWEMKGEA